jgi:L-alanine-DL-glutamate epimerase-like enolase superfamily enzyme
MRITSLETIQHPDFRNILWLLVGTDAGLTGLGETFRGADAVAACLMSDVADAVLGQDAREIDRISKLLTEPYVGFRGSGAEMRAASALDIALWDLAGQRLGAPVVDLLGGRSRKAIRTYNTCAGYTYNKSGSRRAVTGAEASADEGPYEDQKAFMTDAGRLAKSLLAQNIAAMKIWPFDPAAARNGGAAVSLADIEAALTPFRQIRDAVGEAMDIMVEMHSMWDVPSAIRIAEALKPFRPVWIEDPVKMLSPMALRSVREAGVAVCASETLSTRPVFLDFLVAGAVDYVMLDVSWCGGLSEAKKIATLAEAFQRPVAPHDCTGPVVWMASTHLSLNAPNAAWQESVRAYYSGWYRDLVTALPVVAEGALSVSDAPGLGMRLSPGLLARPDLIRRKRTL